MGSLLRSQDGHRPSFLCSRLTGHEYIVQVLQATALDELLSPLLGLLTTVGARVLHLLSYTHGDMGTVGVRSGRAGALRDN